MRIVIRLLGILAASLLLHAGAARADFSFQFTDGSGNTVSNNSFSVAQGSTINIRLYLIESNSETRLQNPGLLSGGVGVTFNQSVANVTAVSGNSTQFDNVATDTSTAGSAKVRETSSAGATAPSSGTDANRILLATFTFTGVSTGSTLVKSTIPDAGSSPPIHNNILNDSPTFTSIDDLINTPNASITVTAVPEPGSLTLAALAAAGAGGLALRRRRRAA